MLVSVKAYYLYENEPCRTLKTVELKEKSTINDLLNVIYELIRLQMEKGDFERNDVFLGELLMKNGRTIGHFKKGGLKLLDAAEVELNDGDEITIMNPIGGG
jgi:molybdopterin converting factor small subunit